MTPIFRLLPPLVRRSLSQRRGYALGLSLSVLAFPAISAMSEEEMFFKGVAGVNEGNLHFLEQAPNAPVHHHRNRIVLSESSLVDGWATLEQCHSHIDAVPSSQIAYNADRIRNLRITRAENIGRAWVEAHTVQMENISANATLCIEAQTQALSPDGQGGFQLKNGPYMRGFLDGYYPMRVSMTVSLQAPGLVFRDIEPAPQPGFKVSTSDREVLFEALFEGRLNTLMRFTPR